jgi:DNA modification methylase
MNTHTVHTGDSLEVLKSLPAGSIEAVVTDPPYGLGDMSPAKVAECLQAWARGDTWTPTGKGFMGKQWDAWVPPPELWREVLRVLKPGGHAVVFAGSRTQDLMSVSLRLAGFEVRDTLQWLYGSGFPKSLDVSKALDKMAGAEREVIGTKSKPDGTPRTLAEGAFKRNNKPRRLGSPLDARPSSRATEHKHHRPRHRARATVARLGNRAQARLRARHTRTEAAGRHRGTEHTRARVRGLEH